MSFTILFILTCVALCVSAAFAFKQKKKIIGTALLLAVALSNIVLGYLWITSPM